MDRSSRKAANYIMHKKNTLTGRDVIHAMCEKNLEKAKRIADKVDLNQAVKIMEGGRIRFVLPIGFAREKMRASEGNPADLETFKAMLDALCEIADRQSRNASASGWKTMNHRIKSHEFLNLMH